MQVLRGSVRYSRAHSLPLSEMGGGEEGWCREVAIPCDARNSCWGMRSLGTHWPRWSTTSWRTNSTKSDARKHKRQMDKEMTSRRIVVMLRGSPDAPGESPGGLVSRSALKAGVRHYPVEILLTTAGCAWAFPSKKKGLDSSITTTCRVTCCWLWGRHWSQSPHTQFRFGTLHEEVVPAGQPILHASVWTRGLGWVGLDWIGKFHHNNLPRHVLLIVMEALIPITTHTHTIHIWHRHFFLLLRIKRCFDEVPEQSRGCRLSGGVEHRKMYWTLCVDTGSLQSKLLDKCCSTTTLQTSQHYRVVQTSSYLQQHFQFTSSIIYTKTYFTFEFSIFPQFIPTQKNRTGFRIQGGNSRFMYL